MISLNLLPAEQKRILHAQVTSLRWRSAIVFVLVAALLANGALAAADWWLQQQTDSYVVQTQELQRVSAESRIAEVNQKIGQVSHTLNPLRTALPNVRNWSAELNAFLTTLPNNITLSEVSLNRAGALTLSGTAATRSDFLVLDEQLKTHPMLDNVQTDSLAGTREQLPFHYSAVLQPEVLE